MDNLANIGGLFSILVFVHFFSDWLSQNHKEAMTKHNDWKVRFWHCIDYVFFFMIFFGWQHVNPIKALICIGILFASHFVIDTYWGTYFWAKYMRKIPSIHDALTKEESLKAFGEEFKNPVNAILFIAVDQIQHILFLLPIASILLN